MLPQQLKTTEMFNVKNTYAPEKRKLPQVKTP